MKTPTTRTGRTGRTGGTGGTGRGRNRQGRIWTIQMGDGTWAVACQWCRCSLGRGNEGRARRAAERHTCR
jgi:hypothetical protein